MRQNAVISQPISINNMGKQNAAKARQNGQSMGHLPAFFPTTGLLSGSEPTDQPGPNMAPSLSQGEASPAGGRKTPTERSAGETEDDDVVVTRQDLMTVSADLKLHISTLLEGGLAALNGQLQTLNDSLKEVAETAGKAYDMAVANESTVKEVKVSEKALKDRVTALELKMRAQNIKFRGLPELTEINNNLMTFMTSWISSFL